MDGWFNLLTGIGVRGKDKRQDTEFVADVVTSEEAIEMWRGDDLAARSIETWPNEMLREGFDLLIKKGKDEEGDTEDAKDLQEKVESEWERLGLTDSLWFALAWERSQGGGAIILGVNDGQEMQEELNMERVSALDFLTAVEPRDLTPERWYTDPHAPKYGEVAIWRLQPTVPGIGIDNAAAHAQQTLIHETRLIIFPGIRVTRRPIGVLRGWGDSILTRMRSVLRDYNVSWASAAVLLNDFAQAVYKMKGLAELVAQNRSDEFKTRLMAMELARSTVRATLIDAEEDFQRQQTPITGLPKLLELFGSRLAAAADMPLTLLMGQSPGGLNATGESDVRFFYDRIAAAQVKRLTPAITRITEILFRVLGVVEPEKWSISFRPLWQLSDAETATARKSQAETDQIYINTQVLSPEDVAVSRFGGDDYSYETVVDFEARAEMEREAEEAEKRAKAEAVERLKAMQAAGPPAPGDEPPPDDGPPPGDEPEPEPEE